MWKQMFEREQSTFKLLFFSEWTRRENSRKYENLEYNDLEGGRPRHFQGTLPKFLRTCKIIRTLLPARPWAGVFTCRKIISLPAGSASTFWFTVVAFDLFAEASFPDWFFSWFHWVRTESAGLAAATFMLFIILKPSYQLSEKWNKQ